MLSKASQAAVPAPLLRSSAACRVLLPHAVEQRGVPAPAPAMSRLHRFQLLTSDEVANSPSRADGVPENMEHRRRKLAAQHMRDVSFKFGM